MPISNLVILPTQEHAQPRRHLAPYQKKKTLPTNPQLQRQLTAGIRAPSALSPAPLKASKPEPGCFVKGKCVQTRPSAEDEDRGVGTRAATRATWFVRQTARHRTPGG